MAANVETMVSANDVVPWHKEGKVLSGYPSIDVMYQESGLDWQVTKEPLFFNCDDTQMDTGLFGLVRSTDHKCFASCSDKYHVFNNKDAFDWCKPFIDTGHWQMETAGALCGGKLCWALLNQGSRTILKNDKLENYLLVHWSHDGTMSIQTGLTSIRVVCQNTLRAALGHLDTRHKVAHNSSMTVRMQQLHELYDETSVMFDLQQKEFKKFSEISVDKSVQEAYIEGLLEEIYKGSSYDKEDPKSVARHERSISRTREDLTYMVHNGSGMKELNLDGSLWGLFNGAEEYFEKYRGGNRVKDRGYDILLGRGADLVEKAYEMADAIAC